MCWYYVMKTAVLAGGQQGDYSANASTINNLYNIFDKKYKTVFSEERGKREFSQAVRFLQIWQDTFLCFENQCC